MDNNNNQTNEALELVYIAPSANLALAVKENLERAGIKVTLDPTIDSSKEFFEDTVDEIKVFVRYSQLDQANELIERYIDQNTSFQVVYIANEMPDAEVIKGFLQAQGIPTYLEYETLGRLYPWMSGVLGKIRILVPQEYLELATKLLEDKNKP